MSLVSAKPTALYPQKMPNYILEKDMQDLLLNFVGSDLRNVLFSSDYPFDKMHKMKKEIWGFTLPFTRTLFHEHHLASTQRKLLTNRY